MPGQHKAPFDDDLRQAPYYKEHSESPVFNQLFAALYDLILCRIPKMGLLSPGSGRSIANIFDEKIPNYGENDGDERYLVGPELIAYLQWLIYTSPFKSPDQGQRAGEHKKYYDTWVVSFKVRWSAYRRKLMEELEKWYKRFPPGQSRSRHKVKEVNDGPIAIVDEGLLMDSASDNEAGEGGGGGGAAPAASGAPGGAGE